MHSLVYIGPPDSIIQIPEPFAAALQFHIQFYFSYGLLDIQIFSLGTEVFVIVFLPVIDQQDRCFPAGLRGVGLFPFELQINLNGLAVSILKTLRVLCRNKELFLRFQL